MNETLAALAASEARLELATAAAELGIWDWDLQANTFVYSARARAICGFPSSGEVTYEMVRAATHPADFPHTSAQAQRATDPEVRSRESFEYRIIRPDGSERWVLAYGEAQFEQVEGATRAVRYVGTIQDITDRHESNRQHAALAARLKLALDASRMAVWEVDLATDTITGSADLNRLFGLPDDANPAIETLRSFYYPGEHERLVDLGQQTLARGDRYLETDYRIIRADGAVRWLGLRCELLLSEHGEPQRLIGVLWDATARKTAEMRDTVLAEITSRTRDLDEPDAITYCAAEVLGDALGVSQAGFGVVDAASETIAVARGWSAPDIAPLSGVVRVNNYGPIIDDLKRGEKVVINDTEQERRISVRAAARARVKARAIIAAPLRDRGEVTALLYLIQDKARVWSEDELALVQDVAEHVQTMTARRVVERDLRLLTNELEHRVETALAERRVLAEIVESTDAFVQVVDLDYRWLAINRAAADEFERIFGTRPAVGLNMLLLLDHLPDQREAVRSAWARALEGDAYSDIQEFGDLDRRFYEMKFDVLRNRAGEQIGAFQFVYDVTDRQRREHRLAQTEEALRQSQKMEAMGQLTGGVAHDFNNLLTPIIGGLDMLQRIVAPDERTQRILSGALASAERAQTLVQRLLAFARRQPLQPAAIDVSLIIRGMRDLIASTVGPQVKLALETGDLPPALADANQLEMALLNLAVNARDAMVDGGDLTIGTAEVEIPDDASGNLPPGRYVAITVRDNGVGMDAATLAKAVEPFFSTKGIGRGTGLGLSMVHGLAAQLSGELRLASKPGEGTTATLFLPVAAERPAVTVANVAPQVASGGGTVLLADDEELVRTSTAEMLQELGYDVVQVTSADEALRAIGAGLSPDIVITDHLMPGTTGAQLAVILRQQRPDLPVLVISGYANLNGIPPDVARLTKPFRQGDLGRSLAELTGAAGRERVS